MPSGPAIQPRRVLAVDGGQSTIRVRHSDRSAAVELEGVSRLDGDIVGSVAEGVMRAWQATGSPDVDCCVLGLTTAPTDEPSRRCLCESVATATGAPQVWLADDAVTAHAGALSMGWGVSVSVGTGVACLAAPQEGRLMEPGPLRRRLGVLVRAVPAAAPRSADGSPLDGALSLGRAADAGRYRDLVCKWTAPVSVEA